MLQRWNHRLWELLVVANRTVNLLCGRLERANTDYRDCEENGKRYCIASLATDLTGREALDREEAAHLGAGLNRKTFWESRVIWYFGAFKII